MTRLGINPARSEKSGYTPARVSVLMITFIPHLSGYFEHRLEVLKLCLASLQAHTPPPYDLFVFDNGSCPEVVAFLTALNEENVIRYLILSSQNIGKIGALQLLCGIAPGEILAYSDDDIFFYPGWLEASLKILHSFPKAGMVSGVPVRNAARHARHALDQFAGQPPAGFRTETKRFIPDAWEVDWAMSTGRDPQEHLSSTQGLSDMLFYAPDGAQPGEAVIAGANHFQFVAPKSLLLSALPAHWSGKLMGEMLELDEAVDRLGYLRLSSSQRFVRHMGNALNPEILEEAQVFKLLQASNGIKAPKFQTGKKRKYRLMSQLPGLRRFAMFLYKRLFNLLYK